MSGTLAKEALGAFAEGGRGATAEGIDEVVGTVRTGEMEAVGMDAKVG